MSHYKNFPFLLANLSRRRRTVLDGLIRRGAAMLFSVLFASGTSAFAGLTVGRHSPNALDQPIDLVV
jgi:hypothetical protein